MGLLLNPWVLASGLGLASYFGPAVIGGITADNPEPHSEEQKRSAQLFQLSMILGLVASGVTIYKALR